MPVMARDGAGSAWEDAGDICHAMNGTLAVVEDDETMFEVNKTVIIDDMALKSM